VVHVLSPGDARVASVVAPQLQRAATEEAGVQVLVLTPSGETAAWLARLINPTLDEEATLLVPVTSPLRGARRVSAGARAVALTPADALALVRGAALKLESVRAIVFVDANELLGTSGDDVATLMSEMPKGTERVLVAGTVDSLVSSFLEAHMRRPRTIAHPAFAEGDASLHYLVVPRGNRASALRQVLDRFDPPRATVVATELSAAAAGRALASLGYGTDDTLVRVRTHDVDAHEPLLVSFGAPQDSTELQQLVDAKGETVVVLVAPEELSAFLRLAGSRAKPLATTSAPAAARAAEDALRDELRALMQARSLHRETLALEPLLDEHDALQVAAAALRMVELEREKARAKRPAPRAVEAPAVTAPVERVAPVGTTFTKLFINVGERDGARKGDFVGAITGEAGISAEQIGNIDLRDSHSIVEVLSDVAEKVITALNGSTIRGRQVLAREDRGPTERPERESHGGFRGGERSGGFGGGGRGGPPRGGKFGGPPRGDRFERGARGEGFDRGERGERVNRGERGDRGGRFERDDRGDRGDRGGRFERGDRGDRPPFRGGDRDSRGGGFKSGGFRSGGGFRGGDRDRGGDRGGFKGGFRRDRDEGGPPRRSFDRGFDRGESRGPRAIDESREWSERGDRLRNARGRRED